MLSCLFCRSGIIPSNKTTYSLSHIQNALKAQTGSIPFIGCGHNGTVLQEIWYFNHVMGTVRVSLLCLLVHRLILVVGAVRIVQKRGFHDQKQLLEHDRYKLL